MLLTSGLSPSAYTFPQTADRHAGYDCQPSPSPLGDSCCFLAPLAYDNRGQVVRTTDQQPSHSTFERGPVSRGFMGHAPPRAKDENKDDTLHSKFIAARCAASPCQQHPAHAVVVMADAQPPLSRAQSLLSSYLLDPAVHCAAGPPINPCTQEVGGELIVDEVLARYLSHPRAHEPPQDAVDVMLPRPGEQLPFACHCLPPRSKVCVTPLPRARTCVQ